VTEKPKASQQGGHSASASTSVPVAQPSVLARPKADSNVPGVPDSMPGTPAPSIKRIVKPDSEDKAGGPSQPVGGVAGRLLKRKSEETGGKQEIIDPYRDVKDAVQAKLVEQLDADSMAGVDNDEDRRSIVRNAVQKIIITVSNELSKNISRQVQKTLVEDIIDDVLGLGPLEPLLKDVTVTEIMVNGPKSIYIVKDNKMIKSSQVFRDNDHVLHVLDRIVSPLGRRIDESSPMVDARLKDGSRVNAVIPPLALCGPTITIRKFSEEPLTMKNLIDFGTLSNDMADFLAACVRIRLNIFVSGGAGSGKTTTLNVLTAFIPDDERIVTIEDAAELRLGQEHVVPLETRPPNIEGTGEITMRELVKNCLRMRPERIIVGEVRSSEALDMLQAMNTGHDGSLATGHSNSPKDMISRLETMVMMAGFDVPPKAIRENIASAVDLIVQQNKLRDGQRKLINLTEVQGMEGNHVVLADIFKFEQTGVGPDGKILGEFRATGIVPRFYHKFFQEGIVLPESIFQPD
jgi:pilus assembly protein CpaF